MNLLEEREQYYKRLKRSQKLYLISISTILCFFKQLKKRIDKKQSLKKIKKMGIKKILILYPLMLREKEFILQSRKMSKFNTIILSLLEQSCNLGSTIFTFFIEEIKEACYEEEIINIALSLSDFERNEALINNAILLIKEKKIKLRKVPEKFCKSVSLEEKVKYLNKCSIFRNIYKVSDNSFAHEIWVIRSYMQGIKLIKV